MTKFEVKMDAIYDAGKIRGYATATIDETFTIRGIQVEQTGENADDYKIKFPQNEETNLIDFFHEGFKNYLGETICSKYCEAANIPYEGYLPEIDYELDPNNIEVYITEVNLESESSLNGKANVIIGQLFSVNELRITEDSSIENIEMPQQKSLNGFETIWEIPDEEYKSKFKGCVLDAYVQRMAESMMSSITGETMAF